MEYSGYGGNHISSTASDQSPEDEGGPSTKSPIPSSPTPTPASALQRRLLLKLDLHILPPLFILFAISFLDRANLGNARIEGLEKSLHMDPRGHDYNNAVWVFTLPYVLFEVPSNLVLRKCSRPGAWLAGIMFCWGVCTVGQGLTRSYAGLLVCRFLMGMFESGFVAGSAILIASYYTRHEFLLRYAMFFSSSILATGFSAFLAYLIEKLNGVGNYEGWRWIFLLEGLGTIFVSVIAYFAVVPWPERASFLTPDEKAFLLQRLREDDLGSTPSNVNWRTVGETLSDWKLLLATLAYFAADFNASSNASFQPTILSQLGYNSSQAQIHAIPIYLTALVVSITSAYASDKLHNRSAFALTGSTLCITGWAIELSLAQRYAHAGPHAAPTKARYAALFLIVSGAMTQMPNIVVWTANNMRDRGARRAIATAVLIGGGNCAGFLSGNVFLGAQAPGYRAGFGTGLGVSIGGAMCMILLVFGMRRANLRLEREEGNGEKGTSAIMADAIVGEREVKGFRYTL